MSWRDGPLVGFDTETTGVDVGADRIVTAAVVRRDASGTRVRTWLIDPGIPIPPAATAVHGITTEQARARGRAPREALDEVAAGEVLALPAGERRGVDPEGHAQHRLVDHQARSAMGSSTLPMVSPISTSGKPATTIKAIIDSQRPRVFGGTNSVMVE